MTPGGAALVGLMDRYLAGLLDPFVSLLEVHKLMYFMQEAGEPLELRLTKASYGPYAENLRHVLHEIEGAFVSGYGDGGDDPEKPLELRPGAVDQAREELAVSPETRARFERVARLVEGFESPFGLELLSTIHWVVTREGAWTDEEVVARTYELGERKRQYSERQILLARGVLRDRGGSRARLRERGIALDEPEARIEATRILLADFVPTEAGSQVTLSTRVRARPTAP